jgi:hypothetical protein
MSKLHIAGKLSAAFTGITNPAISLPLDLSNLF